MSASNPIPLLRRCTKCGQEYPATPDYFYKRGGKRHGLESICKKCRSVQNEANRRTEHGLALNRARALRYFYKAMETEEGRNRITQTTKRYRRGETFKESHRRYLKEHQEHVKAVNAVNDAVYRGKIPAANTLICKRCGNPAEQYHHWSYLPEHRLDVEPLCRDCHVKHHRGKE